MLKGNNCQSGFLQQAKLSFENVCKIESLQMNKNKGTTYIPAEKELLKKKKMIPGRKIRNAIRTVSKETAKREQNLKMYFI